MESEDIFIYSYVEKRGVGNEQSYYYGIYSGHRYKSK